MKRATLIACGLLIAVACNPAEDSSTLAPQFGMSAKIYLDFGWNATVACWVLEGTWFAVRQGQKWKIVGDDSGGEIDCRLASEDLLIKGGDGADWIRGGDEDDHINGGGGNDIIYGHLGDDYIVGGTGSDWLVGDTGTDTCVGGDGYDRAYCEICRSHEYAGGGGCQ